MLQGCGTAPGMHLFEALCKNTHVPAPLLMAKSRHRDLRTLSGYVRPGIEEVARLTAEHDRGRRWEASATIEPSREDWAPEKHQEFVPLLLRPHLRLTSNLMGHQRTPKNGLCPVWPLVSL